MKKPRNLSRFKRLYNYQEQQRRSKELMKEWLDFISLYYR